MRERVASLVQSRTPVLRGEIADLVRSRASWPTPGCRACSTTTGTGTRPLSTRSNDMRRFGDVRAAADDLHIHPNTLR
jgi:hypothetical protein